MYISCSNTVNAYMISVRALFKYLEIHNLYKNIAVDIKGDRYSQVPKKQVLTQEQAKQIYNDLTDLREKCLFSLLITTGMRGIEVARANIEDINQQSPVVPWIISSSISPLTEEMGFSLALFSIFLLITLSK